MSRLLLNRVGMLSLPMMLAGLLVTGQITGQEKGEAKATAKAEKKEKSFGRLPPYYGEVVSKEQRAKIYSVQAKYAEQIEKLREQIESLEKGLKDEIAAVLSPEQHERVTSLASEAKVKRSKKTDAEPDAASEK